VLWMTALLAVLALGFLGSTRTGLQIAHNDYELAKARAIADAGVSLALLGLLDSTAENQWQADGEERIFSYGDGTIRIRLQDEAGKVDLNVAPSELIAGVFRALGVDDAESVRLAAAITEWKLLRRAAWGEAGKRFTGPFLSIDELRLIPGIPASIAREAALFFTVYSGRERVDALTAPAAVLRGIPTANPREVEAFIAERARLGPLPGLLPPLTGAQGYLAHAALQAVTIRSAGISESGTSFIRECVVWLTRVPRAPYRVLEWRAGRRDESEAKSPPS
jgi:general secretion pathway protein K